MPRKPASGKGSRHRPSQKLDCEICGDSFAPQGMSKHKTVCSLASRLSERDLFSGQPSQQGQFRPSHQTDIDMERDKLDSDIDVIMAQGADNENGLAKEVLMEGVAPATAQTPDDDSDESDTIEFIETVYHPSSKRPTTLVPIEDYNGVLQHTDVYKSEPANWKSWHPFRTKEDLFFAEKCARSNFSDSDAAEWLKFIQSEASTGTSNVTFTSQDDMKKTTDLATSGHVGFESVKFSVPWLQETIEYEIQRRPIWDWVKEILADAGLCQQFTFDAQQKTRVQGSTRSRFYDEPWTGTSWWEVQCQLEDGSSPICLLIWSDEALVSNFGNRKSYPVICRILNLPSKVRNGRGVAGGRIIGWLPLLVDLADMEKEPAKWANHRRAVWHAGYDLIMESAKVPSQYGDTYICGDGVTRHIVPIFHIFSMDYKEQCIATLTRGQNALAACVVCEEETVNFCKATSSATPRRTEVYKEMHTHTYDAEKYKRLGLVHIENMFWKFKYTDVYSAMAYEVLHAIEIGIWKRLWGYLKKYLKEQGMLASVLFEKRIASLPPWSGLSSFPNILAMDFADGSKYASLLHIILHALYSVIKKPHSIILQCTRSMAVVANYSRFKVHTQETIAEGRAEIKTLSRLLQKTTTMEELKWTWNTPKVHALFAHLFDNIEAKGSTTNYNAKINEQMHVPIKAAAIRFHNSQKTLAQQLVRQDHRRTILSAMVDEVKHIECGPDQEPGPESIQHIHLCGIGPFFQSDTPPHLAEMSLLGPKFSWLLNEHLNSELGLNTLSGPVDYKIQQFYELDVDFSSEEDWTTMRSILHCKENFRGAKRYDTVMIQGTNKPWFARLLLLFQVSTRSGSYGLACVRRLEVISRLDWKDRAVGFKRVREVGGETGIQLISLESVIRGVYIVQIGTTREYHINDLVDNDILLRLRRY